jgi:phage FluMu gp28-like protein
VKRARAQSALDLLLPYQREWIADQAQVKVCEKSRRVGLTWCEAADRALSAASQSGMDTWYIGYNKDMALEFVETAAWWAREFDRVARGIEEIAVGDERRDILAYRVRFASGRKIVALSSRPSNLRGKQGCAVIDEAAFHEDLQGLLKAALAFTMWGGSVRIISTHNGADSAFNELVNDIRAGRRPYALHRITLEEAVAQGLYKKIARRLHREWSPENEAAWMRELEDFYGDNADEELHCIPRASAGAFLSSMLVEARMEADVPVIRWEMPAEFGERSEEVRRAETAAFLEDHLQPILTALDPALPTCFGEDFGRLGDLTVIWPLQVMRDLKRRTPFVVELRNIPFRQQEQILFYIADRLPRFIGGAMDARGNGQYLAETARQRYGARIAQVMLSVAWYREQMPRFKAAFEDGTLAIPRDADILLDHRAIVIQHGIAQVGEKRMPGSDHKARHGDSAIAAALAYFASRQDVAEIDYRSISRLEDGRRDPWGPPPDEDSTLANPGRLRFAEGAW